MKKLLLITAAAVALCAAALPALAHENVCRGAHDTGCWTPQGASVSASKTATVDEPHGSVTTRYIGPDQPKQPKLADINPMARPGEGWTFLNDPERQCIFKKVVHDPNVIASCNISRERTWAAMDGIMGIYIAQHGYMTPPWINDHCHAVAAIPRNKWVCNDNQIERTYN